jgi:hypothetical protein
MLLKRLFSKKRRKLIVSVQHGLGNRLRAFSSGKQIAEAAGMAFELAWVPDNHCEATYFDLFKESAFVVKEQNPTINLQKHDIYNYMDEEFLRIEGIPNKKGEIIRLNTKKDIIVYSAYEIKSKISNYKKQTQIIKELPIKKSLQSIIDSYDVSNMIGVHVRMEGGVGYDDLSYEVPANWSSDNLDKLRFWRGKSHYRYFIKKMDEILLDNPNQEFFLCTDRKENYEAFLDVFGDKVTYVERDFFDRSKEQIQYALIDMILLSKTKYILGSSWSSFTETAIRLGNKKALMSGKDF